MRLPLPHSPNHDTTTTRGRFYLMPAIIFAVVLVSTAWNLHSQTATAPRTSGLTVNVRLVQLDVVVTDREGRPVNDLTAKDFQVFEDGKPQRIRSFDPPSAHILPPATIADGLSAEFDPAQPASFGNSPVTILVLDQLNTQFADSSFARRSLRDYLLKQPALLPQPTALLTVFDNHFKQLHGFTRDRDAVLHALATAPVEYPWKLSVNGKTEFGPVERLDQSLRSLQEVAQSYAPIPERKNLIWVGGGFPTINPTTIDRDDAQEVKLALQHVTDTLLDAHITLYAVDSTSSAAGLTEITDSSQLEFAEMAGDAVSGDIDPFGASDDFDRLGPVTGGRVVRGRNDIAAQIASSIDRGDHFYTIAYTPSSDVDTAQQYRKIRVVCLRPGLTATTRSGYYSGLPDRKDMAATASYDLTTAAESPIPLNGVHLNVAVDTSSNQPPNTYAVRVRATDLAWTPLPHGGSTVSVYIMAVSLNAKGRAIGHTLHSMTANANPGTNLSDPAKLADFAFTAAPAPRSTKLRFIVRDNTSGRMGSFDLPLDPH